MFVAIARVLLGILMIAMGIVHFASPKGFVAMIPPLLPAHLTLVYASGLAEMALGAALLHSMTRRIAGIGLIALYIAVFPANIYMALADDIAFFGEPVPRWALYARLPLQLVFIAWAWWVSRDRFDPASRRAPRVSEVSDKPA